MTWPAAPAWFGHEAGGGRSLGVLDPEHRRFLDLGPAREIEWLAEDRLSTKALRTAMKKATPIEGEPRFAVPVARPRKILCLGKNYAAHAKELGGEVPAEPLFFTKLLETLLPHRAPVLLPAWVETRIDHEIELAVVLGFADPRRRGRRNLDPEQAFEIVAGYTILNDVTARELQREDRKRAWPWLRCKSFDTFCPIGPWVVPRDSLPRALDLEISLTVNDEPRQHSRTSLMAVDVPHAIAFLSRHTTLHPGDVIAMGTPAGVGPIRDGDHMCGRIEGIGVLENPVRREVRP